jgi:hypothetical protein
MGSLPTSLEWAGHGRGTKVRAPRCSIRTRAGAAQSSRATNANARSADQLTPDNLPRIAHQPAADNRIRFRNRTLHVPA